MRHPIAFLAAAAVLASTGAHADDGKLKLDLAVRARTEAIDGQFRPAVVTSDAALLLRINLLAEYAVGPLRIGGELQDSRLYFERRHGSVSSNESNALEPIQGYVAIDLAPATTLEAGRQAIDIGSRRLVARPQFRNTSTSFTGARFDWQSAAKDRLTAFWTLPQTRLPDDVDDIRNNKVVLDSERMERQFFGASFTKAGIAGGTAEVYIYRLAERDAPHFATRDRRLLTFGARLFRRPSANAIDYDLEAIRQTGSARLSQVATDHDDRPVDAGFVHASIARSFTGAWSPRLVVSYDYASGDGSRRRYGRFDTLYGDTVFDFGPTSFYGAIGRANLSSPEFRIEAKPAKRFDFYTALRGLWLAAATDQFGNTGVRDASGASGSHAGTQFDVRLRYWLAPDRLRLNVGTALLFKGRFLRDASNAPNDSRTTRYGFAELVFTP